MKYITPIFNYMTPSELNIPICKRCGSKIRPDTIGHFFGFCSYPCLKADQDRYEAERIAKAMESTGGLFGKKRGAI